MRHALPWALLVAIPLAATPARAELAVDVRAGVLLCHEWFYSPGGEDTGCQRLDPGFALDLGAAWQLLDWLGLGVRLGYGLQPGTGTKFDDPVTGTTERAELTSHSFLAGVAVRLTPRVGDFRLVGELVPIGALHELDVVMYGDEETESDWNELWIGAALGVEYLFTDSFGLGPAFSVVQPMPWLRDDIFAVGRFGISVAASYRF